MNINYENVKSNKNSTLEVAEFDSLIQNLDIEEITAGINRSIEDFKHGRYYDLETGMNKVKRMLFDS